MIFIETKITVIVPVYKVEDYLSQCIESILAQNFQDFELILVDDGSPDTSPDICDQYARRDNRIKVIHQKNGGLSAARNAGIEMAEGEYLCFIDSDDLISPVYCSTLYDVAVMTNCKMVACQMLRFNDKQEITTSLPMLKNEKISIMEYNCFLKKQMDKEIEMGACNRLFHRTIFEKIRFAHGKLHEDIIFAGDLLAESVGKVAHVDESLYYYRQRTSSIVNQQVRAAKCTPDRVLAGGYLLDCAQKSNYEYMDTCLEYAVRYPWFFVDAIYVNFRFHENRVFMTALQKLIRTNYKEYRDLEAFSGIQRHRMLLFARSKILYGFNAYARLLRVYLYHVLKLDAYADGHGI